MNKIKSTVLEKEVDDGRVQMSKLKCGEWGVDVFGDYCTVSDDGILCFIRNENSQLVSRSGDNLVTRVTIEEIISRKI